ncbi:MAG: glycogen synthase GlgA [Acidobacteriota bacterium]|nr:glycogen synthase GlgA [Acidobacteriota bacterium]
MPVPKAVSREPKGRKVQSREPRSTSGAKLRVLMVASECAPFAKTGGLADAVAGLSNALVRQGHEVTLVLPCYRGLAADTVDAGEVIVPLAQGMRSVALREMITADGMRLVLVNEPVFANRDSFYGDNGGEYTDNAFRFAVLSRAALAYAARGDHEHAFDILHAHDWHASLAPVYLKTRYAGVPGVPRAAVFTVHNLAFQGLFDVGELPAFDLDSRLFAIDGLEYWGRVSALKGGVVFSDHVTTVSPSYARETVETELGFGFQGILRAKGDRYTGILNGIDGSVWDPAHDPYLPVPYNAGDLSGKAAAKAALAGEFGLTCGPDAPVAGMVTRLAHQKGTDLVHAAMPQLLERGLSLVLLGSGDAALEDAWRRLAAAHPGRVAVRVGFDERLAHLIEAGADMFLMPSRYEPCGLNQMYSLRYGTPPVVRASGGLNDTVENFDPKTKKGNGFKFADPTPDALSASVADALAAYEKAPLWRALQKNGMKADPSWDRSASEYVKVYRGALR